MRVIDCEQYSAAWWDVRRGIPTASEFHRIITPKKCEMAAGRFTYINELVGDTFRSDYGAPEDEYASKAMIAGQRLEPQAKSYYELVTDRKLKLAGFCLTDDGRFGCSPDALVGEDGGLECKSPEAKTHVAYLLANALPDDYRAQVHGSMIVTGRRWWDFMSYHPDFPHLLVRVEWDKYTDLLESSLNAFWPELQMAREKIKAMMPPEPELVTSDRHPDADLVW